MQILNIKLRDNILNFIKKQASEERLDEARILERLVEKEYEVIVASANPEQTSQIWGVNTVHFFGDLPEDYDIWAIWGGLVVYREHIDSLLPLVKNALSKGKKLWVRAIGVSADMPTNWTLVTEVFGQAEILTVRDAFSQQTLKNYTGLDAQLEIDPARLCRKSETYHVMGEGTIGLNIRDDEDETSYAVAKTVKMLCEFLNIPLVGIAALVHSFGPKNEMRLLTKLGLEEIIYEPDPRRLKACLHQLSLLFSGHKHLALAAVQENVPVALIGIRIPEISEVMEQWRVKPLAYL